jgi:ADP-heptose:LPS heptosyltransferase
MHNFRSKIKVGYNGDYFVTNRILAGLNKKIEKYVPSLERIANRWYSTLIACPDPGMELSRNANFIRMYLSPDFRSQLPLIPFEFPDYPSLPNEEYIVLFLGASTPRRCWKTDNYLKIIPHLSAPVIVLCGGKSDEYIWESMKDRLTVNKRIINLIGKTSLIDMFSVIQKAKYIVTNDTSASHITVAVRTPSICLLGGNHFGRFHPYHVEQIEKEDKIFIPKVVYNKMDCFNCNNSCIYIEDKNSIFPCIDSITVEQVLEKVKETELSIRENTQTGDL